MTKTDMTAIECIGGKVDGDLTTLTLPAEVVDMLDVLVGRWRRDRKVLKPVIGATWCGEDTVAIIEALADRWIEMGVGPCFDDGEGVR